MDLSDAAHRLTVMVIHGGLSFIPALVTITTTHWNPHTVGLLFIIRLVLAIGLPTTPRHNAVPSGSIPSGRTRILSNASSSRCTYHASFSSCTLQLVMLSILCSQASAVLMAGLPLWPSTEGLSARPQTSSFKQQRLSLGLERLGIYALTIV